MSDDSSAPISGWPQQPDRPSAPQQQQPPSPAQAGWPISPTQSIGPQASYPPPGYPPPGWPSPPASPPRPTAGRRRRPPLWSLITGGVALIGLIVGLLVWAPWSPSPQAPTAVRVSSPTATTALVAWTAPMGGATPSQYDILRDGKEQGIVPASQTSWTDTGLAPGSRHSYTVITVGNGRQSAPAAATSITTITPPPVNVTATSRTYTTVTLHWSPSPDAPAPNGYSIYDATGSKLLLGSVSGSQTSYTVAHLTPGDTDSFAVTATWGTAVSALSTGVDAQPLAVPLSGLVPVTLKFTQILPGSTGPTVGLTGTDTWTFTANCQVTCTLTDHGSLDSTVGVFTAKLTPVSGGGYKGQATHVQFSRCDNTPSYNRVVLAIYPNSGGVSNGAWIAWHGTMTIIYPGQTVSGGTCSGGNWVLAVTGTGS